MLLIPPWIARGKNSGPAGLLGQRCHVEPASLRGSRQTRPLSGCVLVAIHLGDGLVGRRHCPHLTVATEGHADAVGAADGLSRQRHHKPQCGVDHTQVGWDRGDSGQVRREIGRLTLDHPSMLPPLAGQGVTGGGDVSDIDPSTERVQYGRVGTQHELIIPEAVRDLAAAELYPGETMLALCEFWVGISPPRLLALTEGNLRYLRLNRSNSGFERVETKSLDRVTSFTTSYVENSRLTPDHHILELRWEDERDPERLRSPYREAQESIDAFKAVMARRR